ncbi:2211_t:CDS:10 [Ambispora leptoticha]|uniref:COP9 signalosome complex subunit 3 n=1 Tax=Ambispora leptoticha TaxID=144679 RepID=A0A9N9ATC4_9GLOM|nr:2211_t:CDS:10 [Ambispora leptoticha]
MPSQQLPNTIEDLLNLVSSTETSLDQVTKQLLPILRQLPNSFFTGEHTRDPLDLLNATRNSLVYAYFLDARCRVDRPDVPRLLGRIFEFLDKFDQQQMQLAPEKCTLSIRMVDSITITKILKKILITVLATVQDLSKLATQYGNSIIIFKPLANTIIKFAPSRNHLTNLHQFFLKECLLSKVYTQALPILDQDITEIEPQLTGINYLDHLLYHYYGGMVYIGLKNYDRALYFFRLVISAPAAVTSAVQLEAYKKYALVSLYLYGKIVSLPKYTSGVVIRAVKNYCQPYQDFAAAFESLNVKRVRNELQKCADVFKRDKNLGLAKQSMEAIFRQKIQQLTQTYLTLSLADIADTVGLEGPNASLIAEDYILRMIETREIFATISHSHQNGMVSFHDNPDRYNTSLTITKIEAHIAQAAAVNQRVLKTDHLIACSKEYLSKQHLALSGGMPGGLGLTDEADFYGSGNCEPFIDEGRFYG